MKSIKILSAVAIAVLGMTFLAPQDASAYSWTAWVGMTGAKTLAVNPFYDITFADDATTADITYKFDYGFTDTFDLFLNLSGGWIMPRYDLTGGDSLAILGVNLGMESVGLEVHGIYDEKEMFALEYNVGMSSPFADGSAVDAWMTVAPTLKLGNIGVWAEGNVALMGAGDFTGDFDMGAGLYINAGDNQISIGAVNLLSEPAIGSWLWAPFSFSGE